MKYLLGLIILGLGSVSSAAILCNEPDKTTFSNSLLIVDDVSYGATLLYSKSAIDLAASELKISFDTFRSISQPGGRLSARSLGEALALSYAFDTSVYGADKMDKLILVLKKPYALTANQFFYGDFVRIDNQNTSTIGAGSLVCIEILQ